MNDVKIVNGKPPGTNFLAYDWCKIQDAFFLISTKRLSSIPLQASEIGKKITEEFETAVICAKPDLNDIDIKRNNGEFLHVEQSRNMAEAFTKHNHIVQKFKEDPNFLQRMIDGYNILNSNLKR